MLRISSLMLPIAVFALSACAPVMPRAESAPRAERTPASAGAVDAGSKLAAPAAECDLTEPDLLGPFYVAGAPQRNAVGAGYVLEGRVLGVDGCQPLPGAQIEFWLTGPDGEYSDATRATWFADEQGAYTFASNLPTPYAGRPAHIHLRVTAEGYAPLVTQHYPAAGQTTGVFDLVLAVQ